MKVSDLFHSIFIGRLPVVMDEIPIELIIHFGQTALNYVPVSYWTMDQEGWAKKVEVIAKDDKR